MYLICPMQRIKMYIGYNEPWKTWITQFYARLLVRFVLTKVFFCVVFCKSLFFFSFCLYSFWTLHCLSFTDLWLLITLWYLQTSLNMIYISPWTIYPSQRLIYFSFILVTNTKNITARLWKTIQCFIYVKNNTFTI